MRHHSRRRRSIPALVVAGLLSVAVAAAPPAQSVPSTSATEAAALSGAEPGPERAQVIRDWNAIAIRTIVTENLAPPGVAQLYLGFVSAAVYDAVTGAPPGRASVSAAAGTAAHDVLVEYFPASTAHLDADLAALLAAVRDGNRQDRGIAVGAAAADRLIASRVGDGRDDATITLDVTPAPGVWRPTPPAFLPMATPALTTFVSGPVASPLI